MRGTMLALALLLAVSNPAPGLRAETPGGRQLPLFPVALDEDFANARQTFDQVRNLILTHYYSSTLTEEALYRAAIEGMLAHVSPPDDAQLGALWSSAEYQRILDNLRGVQVSIGINSKFDPTDGSLTVSEVLPGSPADGVLQPLDRILRLDGTSLKGKQIAQINNLLQGESGTALDLTVVRDITVLKLHIVRRKFELQNIRVTEMPQQVALIEIRKITENVSQQLRSELEKLAARDLRRLIFDLRGNGGGLFIEALRMAELFLPEKSILLRTLRSSDKVETYVSSNHSPIEAEIVILVDKGTASSSEIFASSLQTHKLAQLVGTATYGKATLEETFELRNGYRVKFIVGALYNPRGRSWYKHGLHPDFYVEQDAEMHNKLAALPVQQRIEQDLQLATAWKLLLGRDD